ncbi:hypothetical protein SRHO_G00315870 [Serrasalmus rhombeus]
MAVESELKCCVSVVLCLAFNHLFLCKGMVISDVRTRRPMCVWMLTVSSSVWRREPAVDQHARAGQSCGVRSARGPLRS